MMLNKPQPCKIAKSKKLQIKQAQSCKLQKFKQFLLDVDCLKKCQIKLKGLDPKIVNELGAQKVNSAEFLPYFSTFQIKFAEKCQKKWSKKDKCMLLWIVVRFIQKLGKKCLEELNQEDYEELSEILGIKKQVIIQQISQIICLKTSKNPFTAEEKNVLTSLLKKYEGKQINWCQVAQAFNNSFKNSTTLRTIKSLKQVYINHLNPLLNKHGWSLEEDVKLINIIQKLGKKWQQAANIMKTRNQCQVKNQYYKLLREQMHKEKIPVTKKLDLESELQLLEQYKIQIINNNELKSDELCENNFYQQQQPQLIQSQDYLPYNEEEEYEDDEIDFHSENNHSTHDHSNNNKFEEFSENHDMETQLHHQNYYHNESSLEFNNQSEQQSYCDSFNNIKIESSEGCNNQYSSMYSCQEYNNNQQYPQQQEQQQLDEVQYQDNYQYNIQDNNNNQNCNLISLERINQFSDIVADYDQNYQQQDQQQEQNNVQQQQFQQQCPQEIQFQPEQFNQQSNQSSFQQFDDEDIFF